MDIGLLLGYLKNHTRQYIIGITAVLLSNAAVLLAPYIVGRAIDGLRSGHIAVNQLVWYALGVVGAALLSGSLTWLMRRNLVFASRQIDYELRRDIFAHLNSLDKYYYDRARTGDLMNRLTGDLTAVREMLGFGFWQVFNVLAVFIASFVVMFSISSTLAWLVMALIPVIAGCLALLSRLVAKRYVAVQEQNSNISAKAQENFSGVRVVKGYALEDREIGEYKALNDELIKRNLALSRVEGPLGAFSTLLMGIAYVLVLVIGGRIILGLMDGQSLTVGQFTQFVLTFERMSWPLMSIGFIANMTQRGMSSWKRLLDILQSKSKLTEDPNHLNTPVALKGQIRFDHVSLTFGEQTVLNDIQLNIPAGQIIGITGPTGSGKSLLAQLISRQIDPSSGVVYLDERDIRTLPLRGLRSHIGMVPQEPFLFSETIAENIAFGLNNDQADEVKTGVSVMSTPKRPNFALDLDMDKVRHAAEVAGLSQDIAGFPHGFNTMLGERGVTLSGGQRQRTALARAIARDPQILILDDAISAVDTETESRILQGLKTIMPGRTVILIGHRVSMLRHADHIVVLKAGSILEQGSHDSLLAANGHYADLERKQNLANQLEEEVSV